MALGFGAALWSRWGRRRLVQRRCVGSRPGNATPRVRSAHGERRNQASGLIVAVLAWATCAKQHRRGSAVMAHDLGAGVHRGAQPRSGRW